VSHHLNGASELFANDEYMAAHGVLFRRDLGPRLVGRLKPDHIINDGALRDLIRLGLEHIDADGEVNPLFVRDDLVSRGHLAANVADQSLKSVAEFSAFPDAHVFTAVRRLIDRYNRAELEKKLTEAATLDVSNDQMAAHLEEVAANLRRSSVVKTSTLADTMTTDPADESGEVITTGVDWFDAILPNGGLSPTDKIGIAAPPGAGKSALALQVCISTLIQHPHWIAVWALGEMAPKTLRNRGLQCVSGLTMGVLRRPLAALSPLQEQRKRDAVATLREIGQRLVIVPGPLTPSRIEAAIVNVGARLLIVDYLQLVRPDGESATRRDAVDECVRSLTTIAQRNECASLWLSSSPRTAHGSTDPFAWFKESTEIGHAADLCYVLHPPDDEADADRPDVVPVRVRCVKARHGAQLSATVMFDRSVQQFTRGGNG